MQITDVLVHSRNFHRTQFAYKSNKYSSARNISRLQSMVTFKTCVMLNLLVATRASISPPNRLTPEINQQTHNLITQLVCSARLCPHAFRCVHNICTQITNRGQIKTYFSEIRSWRESNMFLANVKGGDTRPGIYFRPGNTRLRIENYCFGINYSISNCYI